MKKRESTNSYKEYQMLMTEATQNNEDMEKEKVGNQDENAN